MKLFRLKLILLLLLFFGFKSIYAQKAVPASGGEASGNSGSASYSIGQMIYTSNSGTNFSASEGVQQSYEITITTNIEEDQRINLKVSAYPNPTNDFLTLKVDNSEISKLSYKLFNLQGKLLKDDKITESNTNIDMRNLVPSAYFLKIIQSTPSFTQEIKTFKIIKN
jgi:hypothetical protein